MAGYTYTTLTQAIQDYTDNNETVFVNNIDNFILTAEEKILNAAPLEVFRKSATTNATNGSEYIGKPSDWLFTYSVSIEVNGDKKQLLNKDTNFIHEFWPDNTETGEPRYYADFDVSNFIVGPTPNSGYPVELQYFYRPQSITEAPSGETWLGTNAGPAMLYGSLVEAYVFMKGEPDMIQRYEQSFQNAMNTLVRFAMGPEGTDFYRKSSD